MSKKGKKEKKASEERSLLIVDETGESTGLVLTAEDCIDIVAQFYTIAWNRMVANIKKEDVK